jgi:glycosyltransferase involved in cell wall biosynthesis
MPHKRIAFDARYINDRYHGIGRYAFRLLENMIAQAPDYDFVVYRGQDRDTRFYWGDILNEPNVFLVEGPKPVYWPHEQLLWSYYIRRDDIDLFHTPYFAVPLLTHVPVIMTVHDMIFEIYPEYMPLAWMRPYYMYMMKFGLRKARKIITVSKNTAKEMEYFYKFSRGKLVVVQEGVDNEFSPTEDLTRLESVRNKYSLESPFILSVGARRPHKNFVSLVRAFSNLSNDYPHNLVLVGPSDVRFNDEVQSELEKAGLKEEVNQLNWIPEEDLPALYSLADLVVLPSIHEGFGLPAVEAMACGTPVIAADNSSFPEVLDGAGVLVDPYNLDQIEDAMRLLIDNEEKRMHLRQAGLKRSAEFSWDKPAQRILKIYREIVG